MKTKTIFIAPLTIFEQRVFDVCVDGLTVKEMAKKIHKSVGTIGFHMVNIHAKAGVDSRIKLITKYYKNELAGVAI
jgi:LuxR family maltose regulon positive regulatory protein